MEWWSGGLVDWWTGGLEDGRPSACGRLCCQSGVGRPPTVVALGRPHPHPGESGTTPPAGVCSPIASSMGRLARTAASTERPVAALPAPRHGSRPVRSRPASPRPRLRTRTRCRPAHEAPPPSGAGALGPTWCRGPRAARASCERTGTDERSGCADNAVDPTVRAALTGGAPGGGRARPDARAATRAGPAPPCFPAPSSGRRAAAA